MQISSPENNQFIHRLSGGIVALTIAFVVGIGFFVTALPAQAATTIIYVDAGAGGTNDGSSWTDAYTSLQDALGDTSAIPPGTSDDVEIWVAAGTYTPSTTFQLVNSVAIYGGFAGGETLLSERDPDPATNGTVLSGMNTSGIKTYRVVNGSGTDSSAVLDGFTIQGGTPVYDTPSTSGGGIYNNGGSPKLQNLIVEDNFASYGGGMYNNNSNPSLVNVIFRGNYADYGAGISNNNNSNPILTNVVISGGTGLGGVGMSNDNSNPTLTNVTIVGNRATTYDGGGMYNSNSSPLLINSIIWGNDAPSYPQVSGGGAATFYYSLVQDIDLTGVGTGNLDGTTATPDFVAPEAASNARTTAGDYRLQSTSDAIDAGNNAANSSATDLDGNPRKNGTIDLGAYEFSVTPTPVSASVDFRLWNWLVWLGLVAFAAWGFRRHKMA